MSVTARSYCSGYTGLEMAVRAAFGDFEVLSHSDIKPAANVLLAHHYPHIPNLGDMKALFPADPDQSCVDLEPADLWIGSWPCQPHSSAGKQLGEEDPRDLWPNYLRGIEATRPKIFFGENVARITTNGELRRVVRDLARIGYVGAWRVLSAADVGACHLRKRCFVVAVDADAADAERLGRIGRSDRQAPGWSSAVRGEAGDHAGHGNPAHGLSRLSLLPTPTQSMTTGAGTSGRDGGMNLQTAVAYLPTPTASDHKGPGPLDRRPVGDDDLATRIHRITTDHANRWGKYEAALTRHEQVFGRTAPEPTRGTTKAGNPLLNPAFVEFMMMLPLDLVCGVPDLTRSQQLSLLGDGVVPAQGAAAFSFLLDHLARRFAAGVAA
jgi:DNA (cytosine-5)-methyltransferase 1